MSSFRYWMSGKPDNYGGEEGCTAIDMSNGGLWDDLSCNNNLPFICLGEGKKQIVQVTFSSVGDLRLNDLSVAILEQIKSKLIASGLPPDIRLTWRRQSDGRLFRPRQ
ncbi:hypothetical protein AALO_G00159530 [Alosa alosa]|uniref:C-type lectin domain-containing protein n=2 Tax=Alosa TaxID=34772 RepID=A0AAV6GFZ8_9TELE|nr:hypothetical protein AALO_G00159530 [Alosa alosa]